MSQQLTLEGWLAEPNLSFVLHEIYPNDCFFVAKEQIQENDYALWIKAIGNKEIAVI
jgi:hypothetical protein